jgi:hypothetical protein
MQRRNRPLLTAILALALAGISASDIPANNFQLATNAISLVSLGLVTFSEETTSVECNITLSGTRQESIEETAGTRFGSISGATVRECVGGELTLTGFPVTITFQSLLGTAPEALSGLTLDIEGSNLLIRTLASRGLPSTECDYRRGMRFLVDLAHTGRSTYATGLATLDESVHLQLIRRLRESVGNCPAILINRGAFAMTSLLLVHS